MKKILFIVALFFCISLNAQNKTKGYSAEQIENFIKEVFGNSADELVFKSKSDRLKVITNFLKRVEIVHVPELKGKGFKSLDDVSLSNKYNPGLVRDTYVDIITFNPLKYDLPMFSSEKEIYRIGTLDYILIVNPLANTLN